MTRPALALAAWLLFLSPLLAAPVTLPGTEIVDVTAKSNGIDYRVYVWVPPGYEEGSKRYGVVYTLDADYSFAIARNVVEHLSDRDHLEPLIVVSVAYGGPNRYRLNRTRDYTPTFSPDGGYGKEMQKHSGGGVKFRDFLTTELVPLIDGRYRTVPGRRALVGHSYGGLFATWMLLTTGSSLFDRYVIVSPSLWYDDRMIFELEEKLARGGGRPAGKAYISAGDMENPLMASDVRALAKTLRGRAHPRLTLREEILEGETHNSIFPSAFSRGLRFVFDGR